MKLNKNFVQISLTALITSAVFVIPMAYSETGLFKPEPVESIRITWQEAVAMQDEYLDFKPLRVRMPEDDIHGERDDLKGFTFKASDLQEILTANKSGQTPDAVYFQFGQQGEFGDGFLDLHHSGHIRLIAVGMKGKNLLIAPDNLGQISVFDKADPCPPNCPEIK